MGHKGAHVVCSWSVQQMGCLRAILRVHTEPELVDYKEHRIVRDEESWLNMKDKF